VRLDQAEAAVVAEIYGWYADEAHSLFGLAKKLQQDGVPPPRVQGRWGIVKLTRG
jgi:site-specific DNA recombinase